MRAILMIALLCSVSICTKAVHGMIGDKVVVGKRTPRSSQVSMDVIDHSEWDQLLTKYVDAEGLVNYRKWHASAADGAKLDRYLDLLSTANIAGNAQKDARLAFWINAYNAVTIKGILNVYPTDSIRNHTSRFGGFHIWHDLLLWVGDTQVSLDDIEHKILRKMSEPRIHFAIVCASTSCPRLLNRAYTAEQVEQQLVANTKNFFANPGNLRFDTDRGQFQMSAILNWFAVDFGKTQAEQLAYLAPYFPPEISAHTAKQDRIRIKYLKYDWSLNEKRSR